MIIINNDSLRIRPSSVEGFFACSYQWAKQHLEGHESMSSSRAAIGTAIHKGAEVMWQEAIKSGKKDPNKTMMADAAIENWNEQENVGFGKGEDDNSCKFEIAHGVSAFVDDIVPFASIPVAVEQFYKVNIDNPIVKELGGTIDYITDNEISDIKTSKRKTGAAGHVVQQSLYKYLAEANGVNVEHNTIQQIVLKKNPEGAILQLTPDVDYAKKLVNHMLDVLDVAAKDIVPIDMLFRGNPKHIFCSDKFCSQHSTCPYVQGKIEVKEAIAKVKL